MNEYVTTTKYAVPHPFPHVGCAFTECSYAMEGYNHRVKVEVRSTIEKLKEWHEMLPSWPLVLMVV